MRETSHYCHDYSKLIKFLIIVHSNYCTNAFYTPFGHPIPSRKNRSKKPFIVDDNIKQQTITTTPQTAWQYSKRISRWSPLYTKALHSPVSSSLENI